MQIVTRELVLRPFEMKDCNEFYVLFQQPEVFEYLPGMFVKDVKQMENNIRVYSKCDFLNDFYFVIEEKYTKNIVGSLIVVRLMENTADLAIFIADYYRRKDYAYQAISSFFKKLSDMKLHYNIQLNIKLQNIASIRLARKLGAKEMYRDKQYMFFSKKT